MLPAVIKRHMITAEMPVNYIAARKALAACATTDEVRKIHSQAEAAAVYANQMNDSSLFDLAQRIKLRAERRLGEILEEMQPEDRKKVSGLSYAKISTARRLAKVPGVFFESEIEKDGPQDNFVARRQTAVPNSVAVCVRYDRSQGINRKGTAGNPLTKAELIDREHDSFMRSVNAWLEDHAADNLEIANVVLGAENRTDALHCAVRIRKLTKILEGIAEKFEKRADALK